MKRLVISALALTALTACEQADITTPPVPVTAKNTSTARGLDVYAGLRRPGAVVPDFRGQTSVEIRAFDRTGGGNSGELTGIPCTIDNTLYQASITTPATIVVPNYGPQSPSFRVSCRYGDREETVTAAIFNQTAANRQAAGGAIGGFLGSLAASGIPDQEGDVYTYPEVTVNYR
ncbi:hypothetical protein AADZ90_004385 [Aestuariibius sp. 2305UL40-4]|uniref:hypothetical protein n=1 Tax=Aestuariibius violaceus TaxID=3234132 RepID=UPI00345E7841